MIQVALFYTMWKEQKTRCNLHSQMDKKLIDIAQRIKIELHMNKIVLHIKFSSFHIHFEIGFFKIYLVMKDKITFSSAA